MTYKILFFCLLFFILGRISTMNIYIGYDETKYQKADIGVLLR